MRKNALCCFLAAAAGAGLTFFVTAPPGALSIPIAKADLGADAYSQLGLFGQVFERVRANYAEKPDDAKLIESA
ncbi:MAG: peptidase S41, partial [Bradyrhizobium sp.]